MTVNISGFGYQVRFVASNTMPFGFTITQAADDGDPFDIPAIDIAEATMGVNGDLIIASKASPIMLTVTVIPTSDDDQTLQILFNANRVAKGKAGAQDLITATGIYSNGQKITLTEGACTNMMVGNSIASAGRYKTKSYTFGFQNAIFAN